MLARAPHNPNIDFRKLRFFSAVATAGSFVGASRELCVSQPAVSYQVMELERELGVRLLDRQARGVALTPAGQHFLVRVEELLLGLNEAIASLDSFRTGAFGSVSFGMTPTCSRLLAHHLLGLCTEANRLQIAFQQGLSDELHRRILGGALDLALYYDPPAGGSFKSFHILTEDVYLIGPPEIFSGSEPDIALADLESIPLVLDERMHLLRRKVEKAAARKKIKLNVALETNDVTLKHSFMSNRQYCTLVHHGLFYDQIKEGHLVAKRVVNPRIERSLVLAARAGLAPALVDFFLDEIRRIVNERVAAGDVKWRLDGAPGQPSA